MINISFQLSVYCVLCYFHESGVGVEFIRPETGLINQTPTLIQGQVGVSSWKRGTPVLRLAGSMNRTPTNFSLRADTRSAHASSF